MWWMMKLKSTGQAVYFQNYGSREEAEMAIRVLNSITSSWVFYLK